jgi:hypothetical protein
VAETGTLVLLAALADPTNAARNTAAITAVTLFIPIFLHAIFYRILHMGTRFSRRKIKRATTGPKIQIIAINGKAFVFVHHAVVGLEILRESGNFVGGGLTKIVTPRRRVL